MLTRRLALGNLGAACLSLDQPGMALRFLTAHLSEAKAAGDKAGQARAHGNLGAALAALGHHAAAAAAHRRDEELSELCGDRRGMAEAKLHRGVALGAAGGRAAEGEALLLRAAELAREVGSSEVRINTVIEISINTILLRIKRCDI